MNILLQLNVPTLLIDYIIVHFKFMMYLMLQRISNMCIKDYYQVIMGRICCFFFVCVRYYPERFVRKQMVGKIGNLYFCIQISAL